MIACIITGAGGSTRFGGESSKQFFEIEGEAVFTKTIEAFKNHVDFIVCTIRKEDETLFNKCCKEVDFVYGGSTRQESVFNALSFLNEKVKPRFVLIADAARPFVSGDLIERVKSALMEGAKAVFPAIKSNDTVRRFISGEFKTENREELFFAQTPQGFDFEVIFNLHNKYKGCGFTDDIFLCEKEGNIKIKAVEGERGNFKITTQDDLNIKISK